LVEMSDASQDNGSDSDSGHEGGILAALPRARPQRASPRRAAARNAVGARAIAATDGRLKPTKSQTKPTKATVSSRGTDAKSSAKTGTKPAAKKPQKPPRTQKPPAKTSRPSRPVSLRTKTTRPQSHNEPRAPKQGYEPEDEVELGVTVNPPSGAELVESVADIVGELAGAGLTAGGRLLKDAFSLLRRP
jgi:cell pole-organizing protein PopZ